MNKNIITYKHSLFNKILLRNLLGLACLLLTMQVFAHPYYTVVNMSESWQIQSNSNSSVLITTTCRDGGNQIPRIGDEYFWNGTYFENVTDPSRQSLTNTPPNNINCPPYFECQYRIGFFNYGFGDCSVDICEGQSLQFSYRGCISGRVLTITGPNGFSQTSFDNCGNVNISSSINSSFNGSYTARLTHPGCLQAATKTFTINVIPDPPPITCRYQILDGDGTTGPWVTDDCNPVLCEGQILRLSIVEPFSKYVNITGPNGYNRNFFPDPGYTPVPYFFDGSITLAEAGTYNVSAEDTNTGCVSTTSFEVVVNPNPCCSIDTDGLANVVCSSNDAISLELTPTGTEVGASYNVSVSGGTATSISPTSGTYGVATTFTLNDNSAGGGDVTITITDVDDPTCTRDVVVTDPGTCVEPCAIGELTCEYRLHKQLDWIAGDCTPTICADGRLELSIAPNNFVAYQWSGPNGFNGTGNANGDILVSECFLASQAGTYSVTVTDQNACTKTAAITISAKECPCNLNAVVSNQTYLENGSTNITQHTFTYDLTINGSGDNGWQMYDIVNGNLNQIINSGANTTLNMGPFPVDKNGSLIILMDTDNTACIQNIGVNMGSCVYTGACTCCSKE